MTLAYGLEFRPCFVGLTFKNRGRIGAPSVFSVLLFTLPQHKCHLHLQMTIFEYTLEKKIGTQSWRYMWKMIFLFKKGWLFGFQPFIFFGVSGLFVQMCPLLQPEKKKTEVCELNTRTWADKKNSCSSKMQSTIHCKNSW